MSVCALHGTGTQLGEPFTPLIEKPVIVIDDFVSLSLDACAGDPVEAGSLSAIWSHSKAYTVTGIKANTGHTGAAGGLAALLVVSGPRIPRSRLRFKDAARTCHEIAHAHASTLL